MNEALSPYVDRSAFDSDIKAAYSAFHASSAFEALRAKAERQGFRPATLDEWLAGAAEDVHTCSHGGLWLKIEVPA